MTINQQPRLRVVRGTPAGGQWAQQQRPAADPNLIDVGGVDEAGLQELLSRFNPQQLDRLRVAAQDALDGHAEQDDSQPAGVDALLASVTRDAERFGVDDTYTWGGIVDSQGMTEAARLHEVHHGDLDDAYTEIYRARSKTQYLNTMREERLRPLKSDETPSSSSWANITAEAGEDQAAEAYFTCNGDGQLARTEIDRPKVVPPPANRPWLPGKPGLVSDGRYTTVTGAKYSGYRPAAAIAKDVRADIKNAVAAGDIAVPPGATFSVTCQSYAGGQAVNVDIRGLGNDAIYAPEPNERGDRVYSEQTRALLRQVETYIRAYDKTMSDPHTDFNNNTYYSNATVETDHGADFRAREKDLKVLRKQFNAARTVGNAVEAEQLRAQYRARQAAP